MLLQAIGAGLPAAVAIALSPFPVIGIVLVLAGPHGRASGVSFAAGWLVGLSVVSAIVTVVLLGADEPGSTRAAVADWGRVIAGAGLIVLGLRKWRSRPRPGDEVDPPAWMSSLDAVAPPRALVLGLGLAGANPKNFALAAAAATSMAQVGVEGATMVVAIIVFVLVGSASVVGAVVVRFVGGARGVAMLEGVRGFMVTNAAVITMVVLVLIGAKVLGDGLNGLGR
ncbi:MAG TPA: GAP family protein [Ilumatobacter sp.]|nr:GAP family protein [Ilumatobacter sp.]